MIYRNMNGGRNLPDINSYRMAQRNLSFTNNRGENFTIEEGTVFTFSADYFQEYGRYHVNIKCYEFSGMIGVNTGSGENGSIFSVQDAILQKMNADGLNRFIDEVETGTVSMQKDILEKKIQQNPGVAKHCREMGLLMQKHREAEKDAEAMAQLIKEKNTFPPERWIVRFWDGIKEDTSRLEDHPVLFQLVKALCVVGFAALTMGTVISLGSSNVIQSRIALAVTVVSSFILALCGIVKPSGAAELLKIICTAPFGMLRMLRSFSGDSSGEYILKEYAKLKNEIYENEVQQRTLVKNLKLDFSALVDEAKQEHVHSDTPDMESVGIPFFHSKEISAAEIKETETRTDEEIRGGCARVMYPVYSDDQKTESSHSSRKVISLNKDKEKKPAPPEKKKVDLRKKPL